MDKRITKESVIHDLRHNMHHVGVCKGLLMNECDMTEDEVDSLIMKYSEEAQEIASGNAEAGLRLLFDDLKDMWRLEDEQGDN